MWGEREREKTILWKTGQKREWFFEEKYLPVFIWFFIVNNLFFVVFAWYRKVIYFYIIFKLQISISKWKWSVFLSVFRIRFSSFLVFLKGRGGGGRVVVFFTQSPELRPRYQPFSTYAKFVEELIYFTACYAHVCEFQVVRNVSFLENLGYVSNDCSTRLSSVKVSVKCTKLQKRSRRF